MDNITLKEKGTKRYDCSRGCDVERTPMGELKVTYNPRCCKLSSYDWMEGIHQNRYSDLYEVRFKNTRKLFFRNTSGQIVKAGDLVVVEAQNGHDLGIVTLEGPVVLEQLAATTSIPIPMNSGASTARPRSSTSSAGRKPSPANSRP